VQGRLIVLLDMTKLLAPASLLQESANPGNKAGKADARGAAAAR
jgi:hypothetical protein